MMEIGYKIVENGRTRDDLVTDDEMKIATWACRMAPTANIDILIVGDGVPSSKHDGLLVTIRKGEAGNDEDGIHKRLKGIRDCLDRRPPSGPAE